jgi:hypothetical protein
MSSYREVIPNTASQDVLVQKVEVTAAAVTSVAIQDRAGDVFEDADIARMVAEMNAEYDMMPDCEYCGNHCDSLSLSIGDVPFCSTECLQNAMSPHNHCRSDCCYCGFLVRHSPILMNGMRYCSPGCVQNSQHPSYICTVCLMRSPKKRGHTSDICESCKYDEDAASYEDECRRGWC